MKVTVVGAGNVGTQIAVHCAEKGYQVFVYGSKPDLVKKELVIINENNEELHRGHIKKATKDEKEAFECAELIFVTVPAYCMESVAEKIYPYANQNMKICLVPGTGGGECAFKKCILKGATLFGLQRVPSVARLVEYGHIVRAVGYREELFVASLPSQTVYECAELISSIFNMKCSPMPNYLNLTLTPSNPILHTTRLRNLFGDYISGKTYDKVPLFYEEWNDETSRLLCDCDEEVQNICRALDMYDLSYVKSLKMHYESSTAEALTRKITSIKGFKGLTSPIILTEDGYVPDLNSRYFTADFPFGLAILVQIAEFLQLDVPNMKETLDWYYSLVKPQKEFRYSDYGICCKTEFISFYSL